MINPAFVKPKDNDFERAKLPAMISKQAAGY
jgi:hypothetical protein